MKLKSLVWTLGFKPRPKTYGVDPIDFEVGDYGTVSYCKWQHPRDYFQPFKQRLVDELANYIAPGDTVLDIGAHTGDYTLPMALAAGATGCVFAWEPNPYVFKVLEANSKLNRGKTNIIAINAAAADRDGDLDFHYSDPGFCNGGLFEGVSKWSHGHPYRISVRALNTTKWLESKYPERLQKLTFVKVDTEGHELAVIQSLSGILQRYYPTLHLEMFKRLPKPQRVALVEELVRIGYTPYKAVGEYDFAPGEELTVANVANWESYDVVGIPKQNS